MFQNGQWVKYLWIPFVLIILYGLFKDDDQADQYNINIQTLNQAADGLDLKAVGLLVKKSKDAKQLEQLINDKNESVNNLDLDENDQVDYISVTEYGNEKTKGFSLTVEPSKGEVQEVATIEIEKLSDSANVQIHGNEQIYGRNHYYRSSFGLTEFFLLSYLFSPHPFYASPWGYGYYPPSYIGYRTTPNSLYRNRMASTTKNSGFSSANSSALQSKAQSPNAGKSAKSIKAPLKQPTTAQKSFQKRNPSKQVRSGGFGRSRVSRPSVRQRQSRRSGGFRGGK